MQKVSLCANVMAAMHCVVYGPAKGSTNVQADLVSFGEE